MNVHEPTLTKEPTLTNITYFTFTLTIPKSTESDRETQRERTHR